MRLLACGCMAMIVTGLTAPAMAQQKSTASVVLPSVTVPSTTITPVVSSVAARAVIPAATPAASIPGIAATNAIAVPVIATTAVTTPALVNSAASARSLAVPQLDLVPRTVATSQAGASSKVDQRAAYDVAATKTVVTRDAGVLSKGEAGSSRDAVVGGTDSDNQDTRIAAMATATLTDAASPAAASQARPAIAPTCR